MKNNILVITITVIMTLLVSKVISYSLYSDREDVKAIIIDLNNENIELRKELLKYEFLQNLKKDLARNGY